MRQPFHHLAGQLYPRQDNEAHRRTQRHTARTISAPDPTNERCLIGEKNQPRSARLAQEAEGAGDLTAVAGALYWSNGMALDLENDEAFSAAIKGLPKVTELIASVPEEKRFLAWCAARQSYPADCTNAWFRGKRCSGMGIGGDDLRKESNSTEHVLAQEAEGAGGRLNK
jgi:hypothetical protein